jgi:peptidase S41-like protein
VAAARQATLRFWFEPALRRFVFRSPAGASLTLELRLDHGPIGFGRLPLVSGRALDEIGSVAVNGLTGNVVSQFEAELGRWIDRPALILDLRQNQGGDSSLGHPIMAHLIQQPARVGWPSQMLQPATSLRFTGAVAVLVGPVTHSAAESLAHNLKDSGRATFVGMQLGQRAGVLPDSARCRLSSRDAAGAGALGLGRAHGRRRPLSTALRRTDLHGVRRRP